VRLFCEAPRVASAPNCVPTTHKTSLGSPQARFCSVLRQLKMFLFWREKITILVSKILSFAKSVQEFYVPKNHQY
jgi:hypothetical protein